MNLLLRKAFLDNISCLADTWTQHTLFLNANASFQKPGLRNSCQVVSWYLQGNARHAESKNMCTVSVSSDFTDLWLKEKEGEIWRKPRLTSLSPPPRSLTNLWPELTPLTLLADWAVQMCSMKPPRVFTFTTSTPQTRLYSHPAAPVFQVSVFLNSGCCIFSRFLHTAKPSSRSPWRHQMWLQRDLRRLLLSSILTLQTFIGSKRVSGKLHTQLIAERSRKILWQLTGAKGGCF